jgi:flagella basal body P-ring formation protein FlgA
MNILNKFSLFLFLIFSLSLQAKETCFIETAHKIYRPEVTTGLGIKNIIKKSNCIIKVQQKFTNMVLSSKGSFNASTLRDSFGKYQVKITPSKIRVFTLNSKLKSYFNQSKNWHWRDLSSLNKKATFLLSSNEQLNFHCTGCRFTGEKRVQVDINNPILGKIKRHWLKGKIIVRTEALVATTAQTVNNRGILLDSFKLDFVDSIHPEKLFTNKNKLVFYKLNKPIQQGEALEFMDMAPVDLVKAGKAAKIIYDHESISLSGIAIPSKSGKIGDLIQLRHPKTKKIILGKVIDFNKVMVGL